MVSRTWGLSLDFPDRDPTRRTGATQIQPFQAWEARMFEGGQLSLSRLEIRLGVV